AYRLLQPFAHILDLGLVAGPLVAGLQPVPGPQHEAERLIQFPDICGEERVRELCVVFVEYHVVVRGLELVPGTRHQLLGPFAVTERLYRLTLEIGAPLELPLDHGGVTRRLALRGRGSCRGEEDSQ